MSIYCDNKSYELKVNGGVQYVLKTPDVDISSFLAAGWAERMADIRPAPALDNYNDFIRAYTELHSTFKYTLRYGSKPKSDPYKSLLLAIYGNYILTETISSELARYARVGEKKAYLLSNGKTAELRYSSLDEIKMIANWLYSEPYNHAYWDRAFYKINNPTQPYLPKSKQNSSNSGSK